MRKKREIARICLIVENTDLDPPCSWVSSSSTGNRVRANQSALSHQMLTGQSPVFVIEHNMAGPNQMPSLIQCDGFFVFNCERAEQYENSWSPGCRKKHVSRQHELFVKRNVKGSEIAILHQTFAQFTVHEGGNLASSFCHPGENSRVSRLENRFGFGRADWSC